MRDILEPFFDYQRRIKPALEFYELMVPLGLAELLPVMLKDARTKAVLETVSTINWRRWGRVSLLAGILYVLMTSIGATMAILRTFGVLH